MSHSSAFVKTMRGAFTKKSQNSVRVSAGATWFGMQWSARACVKVRAYRKKMCGGTVMVNWFYKERLKTMTLHTQ